MGRQMAGKAGEDEVIRVPVGTSVINVATDELIGDLTSHGQRLKVAEGGHGGAGNVNFKTSVNRAPRKATPGTEGEVRRLRLELKVLADVGLLGFRTQSRSTFVRAVSAATPRVADYPFTTLQPHLGVVRISTDQSFVIADIPGLIEGAAEGAGLGIQFLKHVSRTRLLLHLVDMAPLDEEIDGRAGARDRRPSSKEFDDELLTRPRWLVFNKADPAARGRSREARRRRLVRKLKCESSRGSAVSAIAREGTRPVCLRVREDFFDRLKAEAAEMSRVPTLDACGARPTTCCGRCGNRRQGGASANAGKASKDGAVVSRLRSAADAYLRRERQHKSRLAPASFASADRPPHSALIAFHSGALYGARPCSCGSGRGSYERSSTGSAAL